MTNRYTQAMDVYLQSPSTRNVYAEVEGLGAGATAPVSAVLGDGRYRFICESEGIPPLAGPTETVSGVGHPRAATPGVVPVTTADLAGPTERYQRWAQVEIALLQRQVGALAVAVDAGSVRQAKRAWLTAHLTYESVGAAYELFGSTGEAIDGLPENGYTALSDPHLTGFHKIEALLWSGAPMLKVRPFVRRLSGDVADLSRLLVNQQIDELDLGLRAHEIVENTIQFQLDGADDGGSHTTLATVSANLTGARKTLSFLRPLLRTRDPGLPATEASLRSTERLVDSYDRHGRWTALGGLSPRAREALDASFGRLVTRLAPVAAILDIRTVQP